jgi:hypothetical protein
MVSIVTGVVLMRYWDQSSPLSNMQEIQMTCEKIENHRIEFPQAHLILEALAIINHIFIHNFLLNLPCNSHTGIF